MRLYIDLVVSSLSNAARAALEELMQSGKYEYQSDFARKYYGQGLEEGHQKGRQEGEVAALFEVLDARGFTVSPEVRQRILACQDLDQIKRWLRRAATAKSLEGVFDG